MLVIKKVLPIFICFFVLSLFSAFFLQTGVVQAKGEKYIYIDDNTIEASGGEFASKLTFKKNNNGEHSDEFNDDFNLFYATGKTKNNCEYQFIIAVRKNNAKEAQLTRAYSTSTDLTSSCKTLDNRAPLSMDRDITIAPKAGSEEGEGENAQPEARCELESLGWIICPILTISAKVITGLGNLLNKMLFLDPLAIPTSTDLNTVPEGQQARVAIFVIWQNLRNVANILFLLFFMFAIFSIATSMGMSNYNLKRILPRVVLAAILINLSYYIFAFAIDATNVLGRGVNSLFNITIPSAREANAEPGDLGLYGIGAIAGLTGLAITGVLAAVLLPFVAGVVIGILLLLILVLFREVAIVFLVVLSPLAAALWILPNTENITRRFVETSRNILLIYPFLMAAIAVSNLAAQLILAIGYSNP